MDLSLIKELPNQGVYFVLTKDEAGRWSPGALEVYLGREITSEEYALINFKLETMEDDEMLLVEE